MKLSMISLQLMVRFAWAQSFRKAFEHVAQLSDFVVVVNFKEREFVVSESGKSQVFLLFER